MTKITRKTIILFLLLSALISACGRAAVTEEPPLATATQAPTEAATPTPTATQDPTPTATPLPLNGQQTRYDINMTINYYNRYIDITSQTTYTNKTTIPITEMVFVVYPTYFSAIYGNTIYIKSVRLAGSDLGLEYRWEGMRMIVPLATALQPGETIEFVHEFELYMPDREGVFGQTGRQLSLAYWYPFVPPLDEEEGWMSYDLAQQNGMIVGDALVFEASDIDVSLQFTDRRENLQIAAGALPEEADGIIHYNLPLARTFAIIISDRYTVIERDVDGIPVKAYTFAEDTHSGEAAADLAANALRLYSELYGPYNRDVLSVVEADIGIGMEFDGIFVMLSSFYWYYNDTPKTDLTMIVPHETSHQWFFSMVGNNQAMEGWLDESIATYSEALYYERYHPEELEWWWDTRVYSHLPYGFLDNDIYLEGGVPEYFDTVYRVGAMFQQDLRELLGDDVYFTFLKDYVKAYKYEIVSTEDYWSMLRTYTDQDLTALYDEYFLTPIE
ncbi:hypothetical protein KQH62_01990 [bacterium]|nr:hypothetical protein [bacterium]